MSRDPKVTVVVAGDPKGAKKALSEVEKALGGFGAAGEHAASFIGDIQNRLNKLGPVGHSASKGVASAVTSITELGPAAGAGLAAAGAGAALLVKMTTAGVGRFEALTSEARAYQRVSNASAEESSRFASAMRALHIDVSTGTTAFARLSVNVAKHADKLEADGIHVVRNSKGQVDLSRTLFNVANAYQRAGKGAEGNAIANDAFGRSYVKLLPLLARGRAGLEEFYRLSDQNHETFSQQDLERGRDFGLAVHELGQAFGGLELELGEAVIPLLIDLTHAGSGAIHVIDGVAHAIGHIPHIKGILRAAADGATGGLTELVPLLGKVGSHSDSAKSASDALSGAFGNEGAAAAEAAKKIAEHNKAINSGESAVDGVLKAVSGLNDAHDAEDAAARGVTEARRRLSAAYRAEADASHGVVLAQRNLDESSRQVEEATNRVAAAREHLADVEAHEARNHQRVELAAREASLGVARAQQAVVDAQKQRSDAAHAGDRKAVADADLAIQEALLGVQEATLSQADAQDNLTELNARGAKGSKDLEDAQDSLAQAEREVKDTVFQHSEAERALKSAQQAVIDQKQAVVSAKDDITDAEKRLAKAKDGVATAAVSLKQAQDAENAYIATGSSNIGELVAWLTQLAAIYPEVQPILARAQADFALAQGNESGPALGSAVLSLLGRKSGGKTTSKGGLASSATAAMGGSHLGSGYRAIEAYEAATGIPFTVTSTTSGKHAKNSLHYQGKAVDMVGPNMRKIFESFLPVRDELAELFYTPMGYSIKNGRRVPPIAAKDHYSHVHVATYDRGGILPPGLTLAANLTGKNERVVDPQGGDGFGRPLVLVLELDGREVGRLVAPHVRRDLLRVKLHNNKLGLS